MDRNNKITNMVLLDDDYVIRFVLKKIFHSILPPEKLNIYTSANGLDGLGYIFVTKPEIIIVDTTLPKYSGREVLDYLVTNHSISKASRCRVLMLHNNQPSSDLPANYVQLDKSDPKFLDKLVSHLTPQSAKQNAGARMPRGPLRFFASKALKFANKSDQASAKANKLKWFFNQTLTSIFLACFYLLTSNRDTDTNIAQKNADSQQARVKVYPALAVLFATVLICFLQLILVGGSFLGIFTITNKVLAASYTWDGGGITNNWSDCDNWSTNVCPVAGDTVTFDGTSTKDSTVDLSFGGAIAAMNINAGYSGTIDLQIPLSLSSTFTQSAGTFNASSQALVVSGDFTLNVGGTFTASSGTTTIVNNFTINGGTFNHNSGTVAFTATPGSRTTSCNNVDFNLVTLPSGTSRTISSNCNLTLGNNPATGAGYSLTLNGTLSGTGTFTPAGTITYNATAALSGFTGYNNVSGSNLIVSGATMDFSNYATFISGGGVTLNSGVLTLPNGADLNPVTITGGTFNAPSGNMTVAGALTISGTPTFNHNNGTITIDGSTATLSCNNVTFNLVTFNNTVGGKTISTDCNLPLGNDPVLVGSNITLNGVLSGTGTITKSANAITLSNNAASLSGFSGINLFSLVVNNASLIADFSAYSSFVLNGSLTISNGTITLPDGADINSQFVLNGGTFNAPSGTMSIGNALTITGGDFNHNNGTIIFDGSTSTLSCNNVTFNLVVLSSAANTKTINSNCNLPLGSNPTASRFTLNGTLSGSGVLSLSSHTGYNSGAVLNGFSEINSSSAGTFTVAGATLDLSAYTSFISNGPVTLSSGSLSLPSGTDINSTLTISGGTLNAPSGTMAVGGALTVSGTPTFNHNNGIIIMDGSTNTWNCNSITFNQVTINFTSGTKTIHSSCNLPLGNDPIITSATGAAIILNGTLSGTGELTYAFGTLTMNAGSTLNGFDGLSIRALTVAGATADFGAYTSFVTTSPSSTLTLSSGTLTLPNEADINGNLTISGGTFNAPAGNMTLAGTLAITGTPTFNHNNGTFIIDGGATGVVNVISCVGVTFNSVIFAHTNGIKSVTGTCVYPVGHNPTLGANSDADIRMSGSPTFTGSGILTLPGNGLFRYGGGSLIGFAELHHPGSMDIPGGTIDMSHFDVLEVGDYFQIYSSGTFTAPTTTMSVGSFFEMLGAGATFNAPAGNLTIESNFQVASDAYIFNHNNGTVNFGSGSQLIKGSHTFYNLIKEVNSAQTMTFTEGTTQTVLGELRLKGTAGNLLLLRSTTPGIQWSIDPQGNRDVQYIDLQDGNNTNSSVIHVSNGINSGNNTNWQFGTPVVANLNPTELVSGEIVTDTTPTFSFDISDPDVGEQVKYRMQIDNDSNFTSPIADYTSSLRDQGSRSFTIGQAISGGTYHKGKSGDTLPDGHYYWRVAGIDTSNNLPVYTAANNGKRAFTVDTTAPEGSLEIADDQSSRDPLKIRLKITANDATTAVTHMMISGKADFTGAQWEPFSAGKNFTLARSGTYTFYIKFQDTAGHTSAVYSDRITVILPGETPTEEPVGGEVPAILYSVKIRVVDLDDRPLRNVSVTIYSDPKNATTDSTGTVQFDEITPGEHRIVVEYNNKSVEHKLVIDGEDKEIQIKIVLEEKLITIWPFILIICCLLFLVISLGILVIKTKQPRRNNWLKLPKNMYLKFGHLFKKVTLDIKRLKKRITKIFKK